MVNTMQSFIQYLSSGWKRAAYLFAASMLLSGIATTPSTALTGSDPQAAQQLVTTTADRMLSALEEEGDALRDNRRRVYELVEEHLLPHVDFSYISRLVLGRNWRTATPQQREDFIHEFHQFLIRFYTAALLEYTKNHDIPKDVMVFLPLRAQEKGNKITVSSEVRQPGTARPIPVNYRLYLRRDEWKIYDVVVDGVSLVANYRASFANDVRKDGLDGLIARLSKRNEELANPVE
jgi:phospholipid transport system substrate-binding protein